MQAFGRAGAGRGRGGSGTRSRLGQEELRLQGQGRLGRLTQTSLILGCLMLLLAISSQQKHAHSPPKLILSMPPVDLFKAFGLTVEELGLFSINLTWDWAGRLGRAG